MKNQTNRSEKSRIPVIFTVFLILLSAAVIGLAGWLIASNVNSGKRMAEKDASVTLLTDSVSDLTQERDKLTKERDDLTEAAEQLKDKLEEMERSFADKDALYLQLNAQIDELNQTIKEKNTKIDELNAAIDQMSRVYAVDINRQMEILRELEDLLENGAPDHLYARDAEGNYSAVNGNQYPLHRSRLTASEQAALETKEETDPEPSEEEDSLPDGIVAEYPSLAVCYYDLTNGYEYTYNGDLVFDSASVVKLPTALALFLEADTYYRAEYEAEAVETSDADTESEKSDHAPYTGENALTADDPEDPFTFGETVVYQPEMAQPGSGVIRNSEPGTSYTFAELFYYMLHNSDNVAYAQIRQKYGFDSLYAFSRTEHLTGMYDTLRNISASSASLILRRLYEYIGTDTALSNLMLDALTDSDHKVMIMRAVSPKKVAHKYGWDNGAYHDIGIVFDEHPYAVVFLSDLDQGGQAVDDYVYRVLKLIDDLHENFYAAER